MMTNLHESLPDDDRQKQLSWHTWKVLGKDQKQWGVEMYTWAALRLHACQQPFCWKPSKLVLFGLRTGLEVFLLPANRIITMSLSDKRLIWLPLCSHVTGIFIMMVTRLSESCTCGRKLSILRTGTHHGIELLQINWYINTDAWVQHFRDYL